MKTDILIVGGGLSGLALAQGLTEQQRDFQLIEARDRFGGRILSKNLDNEAYDLGPAWFWEGQPRIAALIAKLGLSHFEQYAKGALTYEDENGYVERGRGFSSMAGSYRLQGGLSALVSALVDALAADRLHLLTSLSKLIKTETGITAQTATGESITANHVVLALPPRLASQFTFTPALPSTAHKAMDKIATWMAGQAKAVAVYDTAFWREEGLSGDAMSRRGPMVEIHDASGSAAKEDHALFGFIGVAPQHRTDQSALKDALIQQLTRIFGPKAATPKALFLQDWAFDPNTSTALDLQPLYAHPHYGMPPALDNLWDGALVFSGTETAQGFGGYIEGALEAAETTLIRLSEN
ncbi:monoamine oxidase [Epibacterium ulvae]|uniref:Monoamine oxidase n=1 Tax=Epibacterium ulvae TaxID=1156985 RepID=A0A1G5RAR1_9RHOB|nr:NAD(P)/FAD-dependent oxidoreductase [Epibacterium ulvae]SCZ70938.1 monoamine oxidase [Epibacterium ulvae]